jgi:hypothetical protein
MRAIAIALVLFGADASIPCAEPPDNAKTFVRYHTVQHFNGDPPSRVSDDLRLWRDRADGTCFRLRTVGPNGHECEVVNEARDAGRGALEFKDGACTLTFQRRGSAMKMIASPGWERVGRGGTCTKSWCGLYGAIESGTFREAERPWR